LEGSSKMLTNGIFCVKSEQLIVHVSQGNVMIFSHNYNPMERWETTAELKVLYSNTQVSSNGESATKRRQISQPTPNMTSTCANTVTTYFTWFIQLQPLLA
jgi:hypothetical protein